MFEFLSLLIAFIGVIASIVKTIAMMQGDDIEKARRYLEVREKLNRETGDEYYDYLTDAAEKAIFADYAKRREKRETWLFVVFFIEIIPLLGVLLAALSGILESPDAYSFLEVGAVAFGLLFLVVSILIVARAWHNQVEYWFVKPGDTLAVGKGRIDHYFVNHVMDCFFPFALLTLVCFFVSRHSLTAGCAISLAVEIGTVIFVTFRTQLKTKWTSFWEKRRGTIAYKLIIEDDIPLEQIVGFDPDAPKQSEEEL